MCYGSKKGGTGPAKAKFDSGEGGKAINLLCNHIYPNKDHQKDEGLTVKGVTVVVELKRHHGAKHPDKKTCKKYFQELTDRPCKSFLHPKPGPYSRLMIL